MLEESLALHREMDHRRGIAWVLNDLGTASLVQGDNQVAEERLRESLTLRRGLGDKRGIAECLEGFAGVAVARDLSDRAARLLGAAVGLREAIGAPLWPTERQRQERSADVVHSRLDHEAFAAAWGRGGRCPWSRPLRTRWRNPRRRDESKAASVSQALVGETPPGQLLVRGCSSWRSPPGVSQTDQRDASMVCQETFAGERGSPSAGRESEAGLDEDAVDLAGQVALATSVIPGGRPVVGDNLLE